MREIADAFYVPEATMLAREAIRLAVTSFVAQTTS
jgi:hypothetical protein